MSFEVTILEPEIIVITNENEEVTVTTDDPSPSQTGITFEDEGVALGTRGTVNEIDFVGAGVTASRSADKVTVSISTGGSSTPSINVEGGAERKISAMTTLTAANAAAGDLFTVVDVSDTTDAATGTNKKIVYSSVFPPTILKTSTRRHGNQPTNDTLGTLALTINSLRASYMVINEYCSIDLIGMQITSGASGNMWVAIYDVNMATGGPTNLIGWSGVLSAATGVREGWTLVASSNVLNPGVYALAYLTDTGNTARSIASIIYSTYFLGLTSAYGASFGSGWNVALTYTATPPNPFTSGGAIAESSVNLPYIGCRLS